jgi:hypothetical protein
MAKMPVALFLALLLSPALVGCGTHTETFDVRVRNNTNQVVTLCLAKDAPRGHFPGPEEDAWKPPEDLASESADERSKDLPPQVPPGKQATVRRLKGTFDGYSHGVLRCYWGDMTVSQMAARGPGSPDRVDVPLTPGLNSITLVDKDARLTAEVEQDVPSAFPR